MYLPLKVILIGYVEILIGSYRVTELFSYIFYVTLSILIEYSTILCFLIDTPWLKNIWVFQKNSLVNISKNQLVCFSVIPIYEKWNSLRNRKLLTREFHFFQCTAVTLTLFLCRMFFVFNFDWNDRPLTQQKDFLQIAMTSYMKQGDSYDCFTSISWIEPYMCTGMSFIL